MGHRRGDAVFEVIKALLNIPALLVAQIDFLGRHIQIAAEGEITHPNLFEYVHWLVFFFPVVLVCSFHEMSDQFRFSGIVPESVDEVSSVAAGAVPEPYWSFVKRENTIPFGVVRILVEFLFNFDCILLQRKDESHISVHQCSQVHLGVEPFISNNNTVSATGITNNIHEGSFIYYGSLNNTVEDRTVRISFEDVQESGLGILLMLRIVSLRR